MKTIKYRRTSEIKLTNEAKLLREIRISRGLSIREVGRKLGCSETFVRHIETGRLDFPKEDKLREILAIYNTSMRQFKKRAKSKIDLPPKDQILKHLNYFSEEELKLLLNIIKGMKKIEEI